MGRPRAAHTAPSSDGEEDEEGMGSESASDGGVRLGRAAL